MRVGEGGGRLQLSLSGVQSLSAVAWQKAQQSQEGLTPRFCHKGRWIDGWTDRWTDRKGMKGRNKHLFCAIFLSFLYLLCSKCRCAMSPPLSTSVIDPSSSSEVQTASSRQGSCPSVHRVGVSIMIVFKDFFVSVCPGLRILLKADKEKKRLGRKKKKRRRKRAKQRSYFAEGHLQRQLFTSPPPPFFFLHPPLKHTSHFSAL